MQLYFAPLEGITTYTYRNLHKKYFGGVDKYFMPFVAPGSNKGLKKKEVRDLSPENNNGIKVVPQILANNVENYIRAEKYIVDLGYKEVNINIGCPSGTVVAKNKGAGMLKDTYFLEKFLDGVFDNPICDVSIKTRIGMESADEFYEIMEIYNKFPISELIIHPRLCADFYGNIPDMEMFKYAFTTTDKLLCYNGDVNSVEGWNRIMREFEGKCNVMIGRGLIGNPCIAEEIKGIGTRDYLKIKLFMNDLVEEYIELMGEHNTLFKMKEVWFYLKDMFDDGDKLWKKVSKISQMSDYKIFIKSVFVR